MRLLLDENFPDPPGFDPSDLDGQLTVESLRTFDPALANNRVPDWLLYLHAAHRQVDLIVTKDWHQSAQAEEMWVLMQTPLSVLSWKKPTHDPVVLWGQVMAYLPDVRRLHGDLGPNVFLLPSPRLEKRDHVVSAADRIGELATERKISQQQLRHEAEQAVMAGLDEHGQRRELLTDVQERR